MSPDTNNALTDFDLCVAVAQAAIDTQMSYAWKSWKRRSGFTDTISLFKTVKSGKVVDAKTGITATIAPLTVSLNVPDAKLGQAKVTLSLPSGTVTYVDEEVGDLATAPIMNWSVSFITDLDKRPVDLSTLARIDPVAEQTAQSVIQDSGLPDAVFSIEYLFMKFTEVDLMLADNKDVVIPADVPSAARDRALGSLNFLLQGDLGNFILGTVVRRNNVQATPTFAMTEFIFDVHANPLVGTASTLAYLGEFAKRPLPADRDAARLKLRDEWVRPAQLDGTEASISGIMAISKSSLFDHYLIPQFERLIGQAPKPNDLTWSFSAGNSEDHSTTDIIERKYNVSWNWSVEITIGVQTNQAAITGHIASTVNYDGYTLGAGWHTEWIHAAGHRSITGSVTFSGDGTGVDFILTPTLTHAMGDLVVDQDETGGFAVVTEAIGSGFKALGIFGATPHEMLQSAQQEIVDRLTRWLNSALDNVALEMTQHGFIPPGGGVYAISNPRFSKAGDVLLDVIYKAP